jgi:hypothetical protein
VNRSWTIDQPVGSSNGGDRPPGDQPSASDPSGGPPPATDPFGPSPGSSPDGGTNPFVGSSPGPGAGPPEHIAITLNAAPGLDLLRFISRGVWVTVGCPAACTIRTQLLLNAASARKLGIIARAPIVLSRGSATIARAGSVRVRIRPAARISRVLRRSGTITVTLAIRVRDHAGHVKTLNRRLSLRPPQACRRLRHGAAVDPSEAPAKAQLPRCE